jgi:predicted ribosome quality control (RQC) complex YloA/Tae2 family protein
MIVTLAGIELRYLVDQISQTIQDYYVSNIYGITKDSILFKLHHTEKNDIFMMLSTSGVWLTSVKIDQMEPNRLLKRLRNDLLRLKIKKIEQIASERIAYFTFAGFDKEFVIIGEFFGDGNILLCNNEMKILALLHSIDVRHRKLSVGLEYVPPPLNSLDVTKIKEYDFEGIKRSDLPAAKWVGRTLGLPKKYVEGIFEMSSIDSEQTGNNLTSDQIKKLYDTTKNIVTNVITGKHEPIIIRNEKIEIIPVKLGSSNDYCTTVSSFIEGLDIVFTENLVEKGKLIQTAGFSTKIKDMENQLAEQEKAIEIVKEKSNHITNVANSLFKMISNGITTIEDLEAQKILGLYNSKITKEKGFTFVAVGDEKIKINSQLSLQSIASVLFNEAKRKSGAIRSIEQIKINTQKKLAKLKNKAQTEKESISFAEIRKKNWYERYRWFFTSDGILAIGGRDAPSNSAVIRKHLEKKDKIFHGDIFGSPFFILKNAENPPSASLNEVAHATVCFSRAWREGLYGVSAYWVNPEQVKKSAPSGQFLPKGSFTIEGQRNFVKISTLKLAVGIMPQGDDYVVTCGPLETIKKNSICYAIIEPHGLEMVDVAKKIRLEFLKLREEIAKKINIDDFVRVLPAGASQITEIGLGDVS